MALFFLVKKLIFYSKLYELNNAFLSHGIKFLLGITQ